jgi:outer membrane protein TolC
MTQPLLRGAFKDVRMEPFTQAERNVLYEARDFARFRKQFYFDTVSGNDGYLSLLLQVQGIRNLEATLISLKQDLDLHEALAASGLVSLLQVDQVFQSYQSGRLALIQARNQLETAKDQFKIRLGLPPELKIEIDDQQLAPFELNSPEITELEGELSVLIAKFRELDEPPPREQISQGFQELRSLRKLLLEEFQRVTEEHKRWTSRQSDDTGGDELERDREADAKETLGRRLMELREDFEESLRATDSAAKLAETQPLVDAWASIQHEVRRASALLSDVLVTQTQIRAYLLELEPVQYEEKEAVRQALASRLDLMNSRAAVTDAWRRIRVAADALESDLDVFAEADINTDFVGGNPIKFESPNNRYRVGVRLDGPLNRLAERNVYRASQITYQQTRRQFITDRDAIVQAIRLDLRNLSADRISFSITRQQLIVAARQVELARVQLLSPEEGGASDSSRTQDALNALNSLLAAKNALIATWVAYETDRLQLLLDMEALQLDERGLQLNADDTNLGNGINHLQDGFELIDPPEPGPRNLFGS